jgi:N-acyl-D-amino-acid deacylase
MVSSDGGVAPLRTENEGPSRGHPRIFGSFPKVFRMYVREDKLLTLENAVRKMFSLPASFLQMRNRGLLLKGYKADVVLFDHDTLKDNATYQDSRQYSTGMQYVIANGKISIDNGSFTDTLAGKLLLLNENR